MKRRHAQVAKSGGESQHDATTVNTTTRLIGDSEVVMTYGLSAWYGPSLQAEMCVMDEFIDEG